MTTQLEALARARREHWVNHVARNAMQRGDDTALIFTDQVTTWSQLHQRIEAVAGALAHHGVGAGDRVAILMGNRATYIEQLVAISRLGAIAVPMNFRLAPGEIAYILTDSGAQLLLIDELTHDVGHQAAPAASGSVRVVDQVEYETWTQGDYASAPEVDIDENTPALIMYTSGTTGRPKGAVLTHKNLTAQSQTIMLAFEFKLKDDVNMCVSPIFHIAAIGSIAPALKVGIPQVILPTGAFDPDHLLDQLEKHQVTSVFLVPTQWQATCEAQAARPRDLSRLRIASWGAAPASKALLQRMGEVFPDAAAVALFGQTEMSPVTCVLDAADVLRKIGSVGRPAPGVSIRVVDADMNDVPPGEIGEIVYRGPGTMLEYWNNPEETQEAFRGGWFHSGDLVHVDEEGFVYVVDRAKDMIISGGENIYCAELEDVFAGHPNIAEMAVIGIPHEKWGETPAAIIVWKDPAAAADIAELREWASPHLARYKLPTVAYTMDVLPRNASGKVVKGQLRDQFGAS